MASGQDVVNLMASWRRRFVYTNDTRRKWPLRYGAGDCSSVINEAYRQVTGMTLGERSFNIATNPNLITVAQGSSLTRAQTHALLTRLKPGDVVCMGWNTGYFHPSGISHVELYAGNGWVWGHGGPGRGPNRTRLDYWLCSTRRFVIKRFPFPTSPTSPKTSPTSPKTSPKTKLAKENEDEFVKNTGIFWRTDNSRTYTYAIINAGSGFVTTWSNGKGRGPMPGAYNNALASAFNTGDFAEVTPLQAKVLINSAVAVRKGK